MTLENEAWRPGADAPAPPPEVPGAPKRAKRPAPSPAAARPVAHAAPPWLGLRTALFVARCAGAAVASQVLAEAMGLPFPLWAALSALVVSQERLAETRASLVARVLSTVVGVAVAVLVHFVAQTTDLGLHGRAALAIALAATVARRWPRARASMWTAAIVIYSPDEGTDIGHVALWRGVEVTLGSLVGATAHMAADGAWAAVARRRRPARA